MLWCKLTTDLASCRSAWLRGSGPPSTVDTVTGTAFTQDELSLNCIFAPIHEVHSERRQEVKCQSCAGSSTKEHEDACVKLQRSHQASWSHVSLIQLLWACLVLNRQPQWPKEDPGCQPPARCLPVHLSIRSPRCLMSSEVTVHLKSKEHQELNKVAFRKNDSTQKK